MYFSSRRRGRSPLMLILMGLALLASGGFKVFHAASADAHFSHPSVASGTIIETRSHRQQSRHHHYRWVHEPEVKFVSSDGKTHTFWDNDYSTTGSPSRGTTVSVQYDPKNPSYARIGSGSTGASTSSRVMAWFLFGAGLLVTVLGLVALRMSSKRSPSPSARPAPAGPYQAGPTPAAPNQSHPSSAPLTPEQSVPPARQPVALPTQAPPAPGPSTRQQPAPPAFPLPGAGNSQSPPSTAPQSATEQPPQN